MERLTNAQPVYISALLIDDDYITNIYNQKILEIVQFAKNIVVQKSAAAALEYLKLNTLNLPDIIFLDIRMPDMDGFDFLEEFDKMKESFDKSPKIIMLSSTLDERDKERSLKNTSVISVIEKPLNEAKLKQLLSILSGGNSES